MKSYKSRTNLFITFLFSLLLSFDTFGIDLFGLQESSQHKVTFLKTKNSLDYDVKRALSNGYLPSSSTGYATVKFKGIKNRKWTLQVFQNELKPSGPTFFVPHDDENSAFQAAAYGIKKYGGHLIALSCSEKRRCNGVDPNRNFYLDRKRFIKTIMIFFTSKTKWPVITLHNNHNSHRDLSGLGVIYAGIKRPYSGAYATYHNGDADDLIIFADTKKRTSSEIFSRFSARFERNNLNHIFEAIVNKSTVGGHMSNYVVRETSFNYFNIEAQRKHTSQQKKYLNALLGLL